MEIMFTRENHVTFSDWQNFDESIVAKKNLIVYSSPRFVRIDVCYIVILIRSLRRQR